MATKIPTKLMKFARLVERVDTVKEKHIPEFFLGMSIWFISMFFMFLFSGHQVSYLPSSRYLRHMGITYYFASTNKNPWRKTITILFPPSLT